MSREFDYSKNPVNELMKKSANFKKSVSNKSVLKETGNNKNKSGSGTDVVIGEMLVNALITELRQVNERLDNVETILNQKVITEGDSEKIKLIIGNTLLEGDLKQVKR